MVIPKAIASDDGGEFKGRFKEILDAEGIHHIVLLHMYHSLIDLQELLKICCLKELNILKRLALSPSSNNLAIQ